MKDTTQTTDSIEESIEITAPRERVWHALTDHEEFGTWFRVILDGPFVSGTASTGRTTYPGAEGLDWYAEVVQIKAPSYFAFRWHPYDVEPGEDCSDEPPTLVEFRLEEIEDGTRITVRESGFDAIPAHRMPKAREMNERGWKIQMQNIKAHVESGR